MKDDIQTALVILSIFAFGFFYLKLRIEWAVKEGRRRKNKEYLKKGKFVMARVKEKENDVWLCKFFMYGDRLGYLRNQPSEDRVPALIVDYDDKRKRYILEEVEKD